MRRELIKVPLPEPIPTAPEAYPTWTVQQYEGFWEVTIYGDDAFYQSIELERGITAEEARANAAALLRELALRIEAGEH